MGNKPFTTIAAILLALAALLHVLRLFTGFQVIFGNHPVPMWVSWAGLVVAGLLAVMVWRESSR